MQDTARAHDAPGSGHHARRIGSIELGLHARNLSALASHSVIGHDQPSAFVRKAEKSVQGYSRDISSLRTDNNLAQLALIRCGAGIGFCQVPITRRDKLLKRVLIKDFSFPLGTWAITHEYLRHNPRCRATFDTPVEGLQLYIG